MSASQGRQSTSSAHLLLLGFLVDDQSLLPVLLGSPFVSGKTPFCLEVHWAHLSAFHFQVGGQETESGSPCPVRWGCVRHCPHVGAPVLVPKPLLLLLATLRRPPLVVSCRCTDWKLCLAGRNRKTRICAVSSWPKVLTSTLFNTCLFLCTDVQPQACPRMLTEAPSVIAQV